MLAFIRQFFKVPEVLYVQVSIKPKTAFASTRFIEIPTRLSESGRNDFIRAKIKAFLKKTRATIKSVGSGYLGPEVPNCFCITGSNGTTFQWSLDTDYLYEEIEDRDKLLSCGGVEPARRES